MPMPRSRRVFLKVLGVGTAGTALNLSCTGFVGDSGLQGSDSGIGSGGDTGRGSGGAPGTGGVSGTGGNRTPGAGGAGNAGTGGRGGSVVDASAPDARDANPDLIRDAGVDTRDSGPAPRDAGPILQPGDIAAGNISGLAVGGLNAVPNQSIAIGRDAMGVYALTLICTHAGCTAAPATANGVRQINCPCHGSQFDRDGAVIRGPAARPLVHFAVTIDAAGNIVIHSTAQVAATVRTNP
jgi:Rieske Fe-S protein